MLHVEKRKGLGTRLQLRYWTTDELTGLGKGLATMALRNVNTDTAVAIDLLSSTISRIYRTGHIDMVKVVKDNILGNGRQSH